MYLDFDFTGRKQTMNYWMIIFVFVLTALPMVFSSCGISKGNYVSNFAEEG